MVARGSRRRARPHAHEVHEGGGGGGSAATTVAVNHRPPSTVGRACSGGRRSSRPLFVTASSASPWPGGTGAGDPAPPPRRHQDHPRHAGLAGGRECREGRRAVVRGEHLVVARWFRPPTRCTIVRTRKEPDEVLGHRHLGPRPRPSAWTASAASTAGRSRGPRRGARARRRSKKRRSRPEATGHEHRHRRDAPAPRGRSVATCNRLLPSASPWTPRAERTSSRSSGGGRGLRMTPPAPSRRGRRRGDAGPRAHLPHGDRAEGPGRYARRERLDRLPHPGPAQGRRRAPALHVETGAEYHRSEESHHVHPYVPQLRAGRRALPGGGRPARSRSAGTTGSRRTSRTSRSPVSAPTRPCRLNATQPAKTAGSESCPSTNSIPIRRLEEPTSRRRSRRRRSSSRPGGTRRPSPW